ncbi:MAG: methyltransferase, FxLD system [Pseudonocardiaceae bacterium]
MNTLHDDDTDASALREAMIDELRAMGVIRTNRAAAAFRAVPRHLFVPGESLTSAYAANSSVLSKLDERGVVISTVSAAHIQAVMLEQAQVRPGMRVLEIGSGGYNAALLAEQVGADGEVTTVDIDAEVIDRARSCLDTAGYDRVRTVLADADGGVPEYAPYDRIIVTVRAWEIPTAWVDQLADDGRVVVPLRLLGLTRSVALDRTAKTGGDTAGRQLVGEDVRLCSFVPMQGACAHAERVVCLDRDRIELRFEGWEPVDPILLQNALFGPTLERWSGIEFTRPDLLDLWLASSLSSSAILTAQQGAIDDGLVGPAARLGVPALVGLGGIAYRMKRPASTFEGFEVGVRAHGPDAAELAEQYLDALLGWHRQHPSTDIPGPRIEVFPTTVPDAELPPGRVVDKAQSRVVISWP